MKEWFAGLESRQQMILGAGAAVVLLFLFYALVWAPLNNSYTSIRSRVDAQRETAVWMQQSAQLLQQLKQSRGSASRGLGGKSLLAMVDSTARSSGLGPALKRVEPEGGNNVRVWLEGASFDLLVKWLVSLSSTYGIETDSVTMERVSDAAGQVNARLTLQAPNP